MITATDIHKSFGNLEVLKGISLHVEKGEIVSIVGPSGAGKTTLLQIIGTLDRPTSGKIEINGTELSHLKDKALSDFRNKEIGFIFQFHQLLPEFTALENVMIPALIGGTSRSEAVAGRSMIVSSSIGVSWDVSSISKSRFLIKKRDIFLIIQIRKNVY